jgi:hypothetical protein
MTVQETLRNVTDKHVALFMIAGILSMSGAAAVVTEQMLAAKPEDTPQQLFEELMVVFRKLMTTAGIESAEEREQLEFQLHMSSAKAAAHLISHMEYRKRAEAEFTASMN